MTNQNYQMHSSEVVATSLNDELYAESYQLRKAASTMTITTIEWFRNNIDLLLNKNSRLSQTDDTFSVLSIGSGEGDIDIEILYSLIPKLKPEWKRLKYVALEPNPIHRERFLQRLTETSFDQDVEISVRSDRFGESVLPDFSQYNLVLLIQVLYYFQETYSAIHAALAKTKPGGRIAIVNQTDVGIPQIQRVHMLKAKGNQNEMLTTEDIQHLLDSKNHAYKYWMLDARLNVIECLKGSDAGIKIMSFCMEADLQQFDGARVAEIAEGFRNLAEIDCMGSAFIREPIGVFLLDATLSSNVFEKHPEDKDPTQDYRQLAWDYNWSGLLLSQHRLQLRLGKDPSQRWLDIACGRGRWLEAFLQYTQFGEGIEDIVYDLLDPCLTAIQAANQKIGLPFKTGTQYVTTIQAANLKPKSYNLLWSMHGFYAVSRQDLVLVLRKCVDLLAEGGVGFIALASRKSFYVDFYKQYLEIFHQKEGEGFSSAEDIVEALVEVGIQYQVHRIAYQEVIATNDLITLEKYIKEEATVNSFSQDATLKELSATKQITLDKLFDHIEMKHYLKGFIQNSTYCFPQDVWLISFSC